MCCKPQPSHLGPGSLPIRTRPQLLLVLPSICLAAANTKIRTRLRIFTPQRAEFSRQNCLLSQCPAFLVSLFLSAMPKADYWHRIGPRTPPHPRRATKKNEQRHHRFSHIHQRRILASQKHQRQSLHIHFTIHVKRRGYFWRAVFDRIPHLGRSSNRLLVIGYLSVFCVSCARESDTWAFFSYRISDSTCIISLTEPRGRCRSTRSAPGTIRPRTFSKPEPI